MTNKKSEIKKNRKQTKKTEDLEVKLSVDTSLKDIFVADAQNTTFTEDDVNELESNKQEETVSTLQPENVDSDTVQENGSEDNSDDDCETNSTEIITKEDTLIDEQPEKTETISDSDVKEEDIPLEPIVENEQTEETEVKENIKQKPVRRITTKEAYGYHWMGLIYDE